MTLFNSQNNELYNSDEISDVFDEITIAIDQDDFKTVKKLIFSLHPSDFAYYLDLSNERYLKYVLNHFPNILKPTTLIWVNFSTKLKICEQVGIKKIANLLEQLPIEDATEVIQDFNSDIQKELLAFVSQKKQSQIIERFTYAEHTAGRIMERNFVSFPENWSINEAFSYLQYNKFQHDFHAVIVIDKRSRPVGYILLSSLLKYPSDSKIKEIMNVDFKISDTDTSLDELSYIYKQYALTIIPVVNKGGKVIGSISVHNMIYIIDQQNEDEILLLAGVYKQDTFGTIFSTVRYRLPWLLTNLVTAFITSTIIMQYTDIIRNFAILAAIMPIVQAMGGNCGTQVTTVTVRALSNKEITDSNSFKIIFKELIICALMGIALAFVAATIHYIIYQDVKISFIFAIAITVNFLVAGFFGAIIPISFNNLKLDPAIASGVFVTFMTDALGVFVFLALAYTILNS
jgi:magnesium transporter